MFAFLKSDTRGSEKPSLTPPGPAVPRAPPSNGLDDSPATPCTASTTKRCRDCPGGLVDAVASVKRPRLETISPRKSAASCADPNASASAAPGYLENARDIIRHQFGLEVLLKHRELRLIDQELAKCQIALEQLRRCHLIPFPSTCPTPDQMLDVSRGQGPALASHSDDTTPPWAPPFGVVDGPYARHYAKWLIPDPSFDGAHFEQHSAPLQSRVRGSVSEGRTTRNSFAEPALGAKGRRSTAGQKFQALSNGYPQAKDKAGSCILKRADGKTVKLVCLDCDRENFSSTQGFINHCRIAHRRDFKSHEEAAVQSGHPIDVADAGSAVTDEKPPACAPSSILVHPFARQDLTEHQAYAALRSRIDDSLRLYHAGKLPGIDRIPSARDAQARSRANRALTDEVDTPETPHLSRLMESRNFAGSLRELVADAKTKAPPETLKPDDESDDADAPVSPMDSDRGGSQARIPVVLRVPARSDASPAPGATMSHPESSKERLREMPLTSPTGVAMRRQPPNVLSSDEELDMDEANLSPNTLISKNAPSSATTESTTTRTKARPSLVPAITWTERPCLTWPRSRWTRITSHEVSAAPPAARLAL